MNWLKQEEMLGLVVHACYLPFFMDFLFLWFFASLCTLASPFWLCYRLPPFLDQISQGVWLLASLVYSDTESHVSVLTEFLEKRADWPSLGHVPNR